LVHTSHTAVTENSRNLALAVTPRRPTLPVVWLQVAAALAVVGVLVFVFLIRGSEPQPKPVSGVVGVSGSTFGQGGPGPASSKSSAPKGRTVLVPGSGARPQPKAAKTAPSVPDLAKLLGPNMLGTSQATLRLFDSPGGRQVIGVVPKNELVMIKRVSGEWALITHVNQGRALTGWTVRNLIQ